MNQDRELELLRKIEALVVDRERLRAALQEIAREDHDEEAQPGPYSKIAAAALADEQKG